MIGQTVSHYRILERLGEGGMGVVYKALDTHLDRPVALKFLPSHLGTDKDARDRFIQEAKSASSLDHTNICTVFDIDETDDGRLFIAMSCYDGGSLPDKIERAPLPIEDEQALWFLEQAYEERDSFLLFFLLWPRPTAPEEAITWYDTFYSFPRVQAIQKKVWPE